MHLATLFLLTLTTAVLALPTPTTKHSNSHHLTDIDLSITDADALEKRNAHLTSADLAVTDSEVLERRSALLLADTVDVDLSISDSEVLGKRAAFPAPDPVAEPIPPTNTPTIIPGPDGVEEDGLEEWGDIGLSGSDEGPAFVAGVLKERSVGEGDGTGIAVVA